MKRAGGVAVAGLALTLVALLFDTSPLFVPGVAFTLLGLVTPAWLTLAARKAHVQRHLHTDRVLERQPLETTIEVSRGRFGLPGAEIFDPLTGATVSLRGELPLMSGRRHADISIIARFDGRGRRRLEAPSLIIKDVFGLTVLVRDGGEAVNELLVLPRPQPVGWLGRDLGAYSDPATGLAAAEPMAATELDGLRPYRPGTPASRIHWAALARGAGLLERRMRADADTRPLVVLDTRCPDPGCAELDAAVRAAASLVLELARRRGCGLLMPGERRPIEVATDLARWPAAHVRLALVQGGPDQRAPLLGPGARLGRIFYVAVQPPRRIPPALSGHGALAGVLVLPSAVKPRVRGRPAFEVTGCRGYVLAVGRQPSDRQRVA